MSRAFPLKPRSRSGWIILAVILAMGLIILTPSLFSKAQDPQIVATVNGEAIERDRLVQALLDRQGEQMLDMLIRSLIVDQAAREMGIEVSPEQIDREVAEIQDQFPSPEIFAEALSQSGHTLDSLKEDIRLELQLQELLASQIAVSDEEVQEAYDEYRDQLGEVTFEEAKPDLTEHLRQTKLAAAVQEWLSEQLSTAKIERFLN